MQNGMGPLGRHSPILAITNVKHELAESLPRTVEIRLDPMKVDSLPIEWYLTEFLVDNVLSRNGCGPEGQAYWPQRRQRASRSGSVSLSSSPLVTGLLGAILRVGGSAERSTSGGALGELAVATASMETSPRAPSAFVLLLSLFGGGIVTP